MSDKLHELTEKLYREGVEKARKEAELLIAEAHEKSLEITTLAADAAKAIVEQGRKDAASLITRGEGELKLAARQAEETLKQNIVSLLSQTILSVGVNAALSNESFLEKLIITLMTNWKDAETAPDITLVLSEDSREEFLVSLRKELSRQLENGLLIESSGRMNTGFRIEARDGSYAISFTDKDFEEYFRSFMKSQIRSILFVEA